MCLLQGTYHMQLGEESGELLHTTSSPSLNWQAPLPAAKGHKVCHPGHPSQSNAAYYHLCKGFAVLGWGGASPSPWPTLSSGGECAGTPVGNGATCLFWRGRGLCDHGTVQLDGGNLTMVNEDCATGIPGELHLKQQSLSESIHVCDPDWRPACYYSHAGHCKAEAPATPPWEFRPHQPSSYPKPLWPLGRFPEITQTLRSVEPIESSPLPVITGILTQEIIDPYEVMGMPVMVARLLQNQTTGEMLVDIKVCSEGIMGLGLDPKVDKCPSLTLWELSDSNSYIRCPTIWHSSGFCCAIQCSHPAKMPWCSIAAF